MMQEVAKDANYIAEASQYLSVPSEPQSKRGGRIIYYSVSRVECSRSGGQK